jgi:hypothetical protein
MSRIGYDLPPYRFHGKSFAEVAEMRRLSQEGVILSRAFNPDDGLFGLQIHRDQSTNFFPDVQAGAVKVQKGVRMLQMSGAKIEAVLCCSLRKECFLRILKEKWKR